ncbi:phage/plasmid primase, P4 family [Haemophilus sputorum]|uniref:DNA primase family protein n=1 Tax=Haemophilus sputorum TaxID=1078480 RepID=UPI002106DB90|nr:phage/plasmid primase, P4 family [Haemophilus sputorum]MCQ1857017.1 phage/plasmid primase, P4 family [Haemophilus sputorum]
MLAPNVKVQPKGKPFEAYIIAGSDALNKERAKLICELTRAEQGYKPVILTREAIEEERELAIKCGKVSIFRAGKLSEKDKRAICENLAVNSTAEEVIFCDEAGQPERDESGNLIADSSAFVKKLRDEYQNKELIKVKETDRASEKASAFRRWFNKDLAIQRGSGEFFRYTGKVWEKVDAEDIESAMVNFFDENRLGYSDRTISTVIKTFKIQLPKMGTQAQELIAFNNGTLNRTTLEFLPHYRENWLMSYIPHEYLNSSQNTPYFDKWLEFVSGGKESKKNAILAALYAVLTNRNNWQLFFEVTGDGGSGKSVFANIATLLAGEQNTESGRLVDLDEPRGRESFVGKTLLICPEQSRYGGDGGGLKSITGGDPVNIDPKHRTKFKAVIPAVVLIVNNEATRFTERSGGIERRRVIFHFDKVVPENERDPNFMDKIEREVGGIIYKLTRTFEQPETAKAALKEQQTSDEALEIKSESDHITEFCGYFYTTPQNDGLYIGNAKQGNKSRTHLYPAYLAFAEASGITNTLTLRNFSNSLKQGFAQHKNKFEFSKTKGKYGYRSNVHFKNYEEFQNEFNS